MQVIDFAGPRPQLCGSWVSRRDRRFPPLPRAVQHPPLARARQHQRLFRIRIQSQLSPYPLRRVFLFLPLRLATSILTPRCSPHFRPYQTAPTIYPSKRPSAAPSPRLSHSFQTGSGCHYLIQIARDPVHPCPSVAILPPVHTACGSFFDTLHLLLSN
jgi:hypothetical protein